MKAAKRPEAMAGPTERKASPENVSDESSSSFLGSSLVAGFAAQAVGRGDGAALACGPNRQEPPCTPSPSPCRWSPAPATK